MGRAPRIKDTLPDFRESSRVTRHSRVFRKLTGSQRTPGKWGVTICGNHPGGRTLAHKVHTQGYYWPTMKSDAADYVRKCDWFQQKAPVLRSPT